LAAPAPRQKASAGPRDRAERPPGRRKPGCNGSGDSAEKGRCFSIKQLLCGTFPRTGPKAKKKGFISRGNKALSRIQGSYGRESVEKILHFQVGFPVFVHLNSPRAQDKIGRIGAQQFLNFTETANSSDGEPPCTHTPGQTVVNAIPASKQPDFFHRLLFLFHRYHEKELCLHFILPKLCQNFWRTANS